MIFRHKIRTQIRPFGRRLFDELPLLALVFIGVLISVFAALWIKQTEHKVAQQEFVRRCLVQQQFLINNLDSYENVLFALHLLAENNESLEPKEFERAADAILQRSPGILAVQWVPIVKADDLPTFVQHVRALSSPNFTLHEMIAEGDFVPLQLPSPRKQHAIITYVHPIAGNEKILGYDIFTGPTASDLQRARQTRQPTLTRVITLVQGVQGVVLTSYVDRKETLGGINAPLAGPGFVQVVIRILPMLGQLRNVGLSEHVDFALYDTTDTERAPLYAELGDVDQPLDPIPAYDAFVTPETILHDLRIGGRNWRACYRQNAEWLDATGSYFPLAVLIGGVLLTLTFAAFLDQLRHHARVVEKQVHLRTAELNESRALLDSVIEHSSSAIWVKDTELRYFLVNDEFCRTYARERANIIGQNDGDFYEPATAAEIECIDRQVLQTGQPIRYEGSYTVRGQLLTYLVSKFPLRRVDGSIYAVGGIATDMTPLHQAKKEKSLMERRLLETQKSESLGVLAGGIAHDFNNLLTGILGHANLLAVTIPRASGSHASIGQIENAAHRAAELCRHMLAFSGRGRYVLETVELGSLVRDLLPLIQPSLGKTVRVQTDFSPELPPVTADITQLRQAIINLVVNASESIGAPGGDIIIRTRLIQADEKFFSTCVQAPTLPPGDYIALEVSDTGCGMESATLTRIFDPFFTTKFSGRGLGLSTVLGIMRGHQGAIRVLSQPAHGSTFHLYLPVSLEKIATPACPQQTADTSTRKRIILVDDEATVREISAQLLVAIGYDTTIAASGEEAVRLFQSSPSDFDVALIDLTMPDMGGGDVMKAMRERRADIPVILMSGYTETDAADLIAAPRTGFLPKPFTLDALRSKIAAILTAE